MPNTPPWWQTGVIYQVYPRSFQDTNADGVGDLNGITSRLDHLVELGITAVWVSPFYPSPMADFGYDVSNYTGVDPLFGTLADFDALLATAHARGLKLILDFVPNHTSDQHPWFLASSSSRLSPKRDWYLWRNPAPNGGPPNNWMSNFGGTAWTLDEPSGQYYYHSFLPQQPDLNWRNPAVKQAMFEAMRFWLDKGIDGFRMDVLWLLIKDDQFRDNLPNPDFHGGSSFWSVLPTWTADQPETHTIVAEMRTLVDRYPGDRVLIGEIYLPIDKLVAFYGAPSLLGAQMPFNFWLIQTAWNAADIADLICRYEAALPAGAWPNWVLGNHDQHRLATRVGPAQARVAAMLLLTLRGTPTMYYGDELGMPDASIPPNQVKDPAELRQPGQGFGRDPERSPMLWDQGWCAGFTTGASWLPLVDNWQQLAAARQSADPTSTLTLYRTLLALRRNTPALLSGATTNVHAQHGVLSFVRQDMKTSLQILLNLTGDPQTITCSPGIPLLSTDPKRTLISVEQQIQLEPNEGLILQIE